jgi:hypothetical protein
VAWILSTKSGVGTSNFSSCFGRSVSKEVVVNAEYVANFVDGSAPEHLYKSM